MTPTSPKRRIRIDASYLSSNSGCEMATHLALLQGYRSPIPSNDMQFGTAFHHFAAEMYRTGGDVATSLKGATEIFARPCNVKTNKQYMTKMYLTTTCFDWWEWHQRVDQHVVLQLPDGTPAVEQSFAFPVFEDEACIIELCGTIDRIGKIKNGCFAIVDYKTTSVTDKLGYLEQYELSVQLRTYYKAIQYYASVAPDSIYAAINKEPIGVRIDGIFLQGATKPVEFISSDVMLLSAFDMAEYDILLQRTCHKLAALVRAEHSPSPVIYREGMMTGYCNKKYGMCSFFDYCVAKDPAVKQSILERSFVKKFYDPLMFGKD